jgi:hypothetical protein
VITISGVGSDLCGICMRVLVPRVRTRGSRTSHAGPAKRFAAGRQTLRVIPSAELT